MFEFKKYFFKGDGSCLYHAVAHQAGLITTYSKGDDMVSGHLRRLALLTMLNYPAVRLESGLSEEQWLGKQKQVVHPTSWGGDEEVRLLAVGLKCHIIVITDSSSGNVLVVIIPAHHLPFQV